MDLDIQIFISKLNLVFNNFADFYLFIYFFFGEF